MNIINHCYIIKFIYVHMIISFWNIAISQISSSKWQCTNENKKHALLYNQQPGWGRSVHFNIWIHFYPVGDMITGTKAGDGQYARTDYTGACVCLIIKSWFLHVCPLVLKMPLDSSCSDPLVCVCVWIIEEKPEVSEVARGLYIPCPEHYKNYCVHGDCEYPNMLSTPSCRYTHTHLWCVWSLKRIPSRKIWINVCVQAHSFLWLCMEL